MITVGTSWDGAFRYARTTSYTKQNFFCAHINQSINQLLNSQKKTISMHKIRFQIQISTTGFGRTQSSRKIFSFFFSVFFPLLPPATTTLH
jgi:hypothetical protein